MIFGLAELDIGFLIRFNSELSVLTSSGYADLAMSFEWRRVLRWDWYLAKVSTAVREEGEGVCIGGIKSTKSCH